MSPGLSPYLPRCMLYGFCFAELFILYWARLSGQQVQERHKNKVGQVTTSDVNIRVFFYLAAISRRREFSG